MSEVMIAFDPGTINTAFVKASVLDGTLLEILDYGMIGDCKGQPVAERLPIIVKAAAEKLAEPPIPSRLWVELFQFYGARRGAVWNAMLVGALLFLPITREHRDMDAYSSAKVQWWTWLKHHLSIEDDKEMWSALRGHLQTHGIEVTDEMEEAFAGNQHLLDSLGLLIFAAEGAEYEEHEARSATH